MSGIHVGRNGLTGWRLVEVHGERMVPYEDIGACMQDFSWWCVSVGWVLGVGAGILFGFIAWGWGR